MSKSAELDRRELEAQGRLAKAQEKEAKARTGSLEKDAAHEEVAQAVDELAAIDDQRLNPEAYEEQVVLVAPNPSHSGLDPTLGVEWQDGEALVARSVAERLVAEFPYYEIEETA